MSISDIFRASPSYVKREKGSDQKGRTNTSGAAGMQ